MIASTITGLVVLGYLLVLSIIDIKSKEMWSVYTTAGVFILGILNIETLGFGIMAFVFGYMLYEIGLFYGVADIKLMAVLGLMVGDLNTFLLMIFLVTFFNLVYQLVIKKFFKITEKKDIPFIPVYFFTYATIFLISVL